MNDRKWSAALDLLCTLFAEKGYQASLEGAELIRDVAQVELNGLHHPLHTKTPSGEGMPPAAISGRLAASITVSGEEGSLTAYVGPTDEASSKNGPYGRIQELGGPSEGHPMRWLEDGIWHEADFRELPSRPYLKPATDLVVDSGHLEQIYVEKWTEAELEATG